MLKDSKTPPPPFFFSLCRHIFLTSSSTLESGICWSFTSKVEQEVQWANTPHLTLLPTLKSGIQLSSPPPTGEEEKWFVWTLYLTLSSNLEGGIKLRPPSTVEEEEKWFDTLCPTFSSTPDSGMQVSSPPPCRDSVFKSVSDLTSNPLFDSGGEDVRKNLPPLYTETEGKLKTDQASVSSRFPKWAPQSTILRGKDRAHRIVYVDQGTLFWESINKFNSWYPPGLGRNSDGHGQE